MTRALAITLAPPLRQTRSSTCRDRVGWVITCGAGAASCGLDGSGAFSLGPSGFHLPAACRRLTPLVDIRAITAYCEDIAPDPGSCTLEIQGTVQDRSFLIRVGAVKALRPSKGQEPAGANFSTAIRRAGPVTPNVFSSLTEEPVMSIMTGLTRADGVDRPVGTAGAPVNVRAADWLCRSGAASRLRLSPARFGGEVP